MVKHRGREGFDKGIVKVAVKLSTVVADLTGQQLRRIGRELVFLCPFHDDHDPSLRADDEKDGGLWNCFPCDTGGDVIKFVELHQHLSFSEAVTFLGIKYNVEPLAEPAKKQIVATYDYRNEQGELLYQVVRYEPKGFRQRQPDGNGHWIWNTQGMQPLVYRRRELQGCEVVIVVEGEKDVDGLWNLNLPATCNAGGAGKWKPAHTRQLVDAGVKRIVVIPDADSPGQSHAQAVVRCCASMGLTVKIVVLPDNAKDVSAWLERGATKDDLMTLIRDTSPYEQPSGGTRVVPPPSSPMAVARDLAKALYTNSDAVPLVRDHRGDFYRWNGTCWLEIDKRDIRGAAYRWLEHARYYHPEKGELPFDPSRRKVSDVIDALRAVVLLDSSVEAPCWTNGMTDPPANEMISMTNGLLHVPTRTLRPNTPHFFCHHSLAFPFSAECAPPARWLRFLHELWDDDESSISALQEVMGYILGGDTRQQKIFLFVGPKRSGKGTIGRVLTGLLGAHNVAAPTLAGLSTNFGLSPLIGKPLGLISDARLSGKSDSKVVVERLLSVSGEDSITIDRKYKDPLTGRLPTRFVVLTNELPRLADSSGALASRFVVFVLRNSFYGKENPRLTDDLLMEAPAIFNWALEGLDRLNVRGFFDTPQSGKDAIQQLEDLSSPISAFIRDTCVVGPHHVQAEMLWAAWKAWCDADNRHPGTKVVFGRDLRAAVPTVKRVRPRSGETRLYAYGGIALRENSRTDTG